jgi:phosphate uptake regulator
VARRLIADDLKVNRRRYETEEECLELLELRAYSSR